MPGAEATSSDGGNPRPGSGGATPDVGPDAPDGPRRAGVPSRLTAALLFAGTVLGGALGAGIGWGLVDVGCRGDCALPLAVGILVGGATGAAGVGVVAVLVLRAMNEWRLPHAAVRGRPESFPLIQRASQPGAEPRRGEPGAPGATEEPRRDGPPPSP